MAGIYTTNDGDMWDLISYNVYGDEQYATDIVLNNEQYVGVGTFEAGVEIFCPDIPVPTSTPVPPWQVPS